MLLEVLARDSIVEHKDLAAEVEKSHLADVPETIGQLELRAALPRQLTAAPSPFFPLSDLFAALRIEHMEQLEIQRVSVSLLPSLRDVPHEVPKARQMRQDHVTKLVREVHLLIFQDNDSILQ